jgi:hypothetical protein
MDNGDFDYGRGLVFTWAPSTVSDSLKMNINVKEDGRYRLFIRLFKNQAGGKLRISLDANNISLGTVDKINKFVWEDLGDFSLGKGSHSLVIQNINGFNAVNILALVPTSELANLREETDNLMKNKTAVYIYEAETDLYGDNVEINNKFGWAASNGGVVKLTRNGRMWQEFGVAKEGYYRFGIRAKGMLNVTVDNTTFQLVSKNLSFSYSKPIYLEKKSHKIEFKSGTDVPAYLDVIWAYSVNSNEMNKTVEDLFRAGYTTASISSFEKVSPTLWKIKVNSSQPFMLSFAESYDPLWKARVYKNGKEVETVHSIPLYSVLNGYSIEETGNLDIELVYEPQELFNIGIIISGATILFSLIYLLCEWRRSRNVVRVSG